MWFNNIAKGLQEQVEKAGQDLGIKETLANAQARLGTFSEDILDVKTGSANGISPESNAALDEAAIIRHQEEGTQEEEANESLFDNDTNTPATDFRSKGPSGREGVGVFKEENALLRKELRDLKMAAADAWGEVEDLKEKLQDAEKSYLADQERVTNLQASNDRLDARLTASEEKSFSLEQAARIAMDESSQLRKQLNEALESSKKLEANHMEEIGGLKAQLDDVSKGPLTPESKLRVGPESAGSFRSPEGLLSPSQSEDTQSEVQSMKVKLQKAKRTLDNMKKRESEAIAAKTDAEAKIGQLEAELVLARVSSANAETSSESQQADLETECRKLQNQVADLEHDLATVSERYESINSQEDRMSETLSSELDALRSQFRRSEVDRNAAENKLRDLRLVVEDNQAQIAGIKDLRNRLESLEQEKQNALKELENLKAKSKETALTSRQDYEASFVQRQKEIDDKNLASEADFKAQLSEKENTISKLNGHIEKSQQELDMQTIQLQDLRIERDTVKSQCDKQQTEISEWQNVSSYHVQAQADFEAHSKEMKEKIASLEEQLGEANETVRNLTSRVEVVQSKLADREALVLQKEGIISSFKIHNQEVTHNEVDQSGKEEDTIEAGFADENQPVVPKKSKRRPRKKAAVANGIKIEAGPHSLPSANGSLPTLHIETDRQNSTTLNQQELKGNPLYSPREEVLEPSTPPMQEGGSSILELRLELQATKEDLERQKVLVADLQLKLAATHSVPPGLSPQSHAQDAHLNRERDTTSIPQAYQRLAVDLQSARLELSSARRRIVELENEVRLRSRLEDISIKVNNLEQQRSGRNNGCDSNPEIGTSTPVEDSRPSSAGTTISNDSSNYSETGEAAGKSLSKRKSKEQFGAVQQRIASLEEQLSSAKQSAKSSRSSGSVNRSLGSDEQDSADVIQLKTQLQAARQKSQELEALQRRGKTQEGQAAHLANKVQELRNELEGALKSRDTAQSELQACLSQIQRLESDLQDRNQQFESLNDNALARIQELEASLQEKQADLDTLNEQLKLLRDQSETSSQSLTGVVKKWEGKVETLSLRVEALGKEKEELEVSMHGKAQNLQASQQSIQDLQSSKEELEKSLRAQEESYKGLAAEHQQVQRDLKATQTSLEGQEKAYGDLRVSYTELETQRAELEALSKSKDNAITHIKEQLAARENALSAVRDGSNAELKMVEKARKDAEARADRAEASVKQVQEELRQAEERVEAALRDARQNQGSTQARLNDAQSRVQSAEEREQTLSVKLRQLEEDLQNQAELSRVNLIQAGKDAQAKADVQVEKAKQEADDEAERVRLEHEEQCKALRVQIQADEEELEDLKQKLEEAKDSVVLLGETQTQIGNLKRELETAREAQAQNEGKLAEAQRVAEQEKASALERQKRFNLLNNQFKRKEIAFAKDLQTVQEKAETSERTVISLQAECRSIQQEKQALEEQLRQAESSCKKAQKEHESASQQLQEALKNFRASQEEVNTLKSRLQSLEGHSTGLSEEEVEGRVQSRIEEVEQKWKLKAQNEEAALSQARLEVEVANERVNAAEMAKIQLSMRLAELDDLKAQMNSSREPELTVSVNAQEQLEDKGPPGVMQIGGSQANGPSTAGLLDIFGCAVNNRR